MDGIVLSKEYVMRHFPERPRSAHKGNFGRVLLLCGSKGYTGAAYLAAMGALRSGAGLVYLGVPESIYQIEAVKLNEAIVFSLPDCGGKFGKDAWVALESVLENKDAVLFGCGVGQSAETMVLCEHLIKNYPGILILDADGINLASKHKDLLRDRTAPTILTPHEGEYLRLTGRKPADRVSDAAQTAKDLGSIIVLKGRHSVITDGETSYINPMGNPGMAVGGSGDLLSGIILSLAGQGIPPLQAAACGAWLHGAAGDVCAGELGEYGMLPTDMLQVLPRLIGKAGCYEKNNCLYHGHDTPYGL